MSRSFVAASSKQLTHAAAVRTASPLTLACWFRPVNLGGGNPRGLVAIDSNDASEFFGVRITTGGNVQALVGQASFGENSQTTGAASNGVWAHAAGVFASSTSRTAYLNGVAATPNTGNYTPGAMSHTRIGALANTNFFDGEIADAAIWNVALSPSEIQLLARGYSPLTVRRSNLIYWPMNMGQSPERDVVTGGYPMTLVNTPEFSPAQPPLIPLSGGTGRRGRRGR